MDVHFPNQIPFLNKSTANPPSKWNKKNKTKKHHWSYKLSCVVLPHPQTLPSHHLSPSSYPSSRSGFLTLRFLPTPLAFDTPMAPLWPPVTPHPPPHPPSPQGKPAAPSPLCLPSPPSSSTSASPCLCVWEASKGREEREAVEEERWAGREGSYRSDVKLELEAFLFWHALSWLYISSESVEFTLSFTLSKFCQHPSVIVSCSFVVFFAFSYQFQ